MDENKQMIDSLLNAPDGVIKTASDAGSMAIRTRLREEGFSRQLFNVEPVTHSDMVPDVSRDDNLVIIDEIEPESPGAWNISLDGNAESYLVSAPRFATRFYDITTPEFHKNVDFLATYRQDLKKVITNNALLSIQDREDANLLADVDAIVGTVDTPSPVSGIVQHFGIAADMGRDTLVDIKNILEGLSLPVGTILMNRITASALLKEGRETVGGDLSETLYLEGRSALEKRNILGMKMLFTLKRDLVPDNCVYVFTEPSFLGKFYELHKPTMFVEKKIKTLRWQARETIGMTIANVLGVAKVTLSPVS